MPAPSADAALDDDPYAVIAPFYDLGLQGFDDDVSLYIEYGRRARGPVLELGCGTGRLTLALAGAGHSVTGIDRSAAMLALARARLAAAPGLPATFCAGDMRSLALDQRFGLALIPLDSFLHLADRQEQEACLRGVRACLRPRGLLLLDLPGPAAAGWEDWSPGVRPLVLAWSAVAEDGARVNKYSSFSADAARQRHLVTEIYERQRADGCIQRWTVEYALRFIFPGELALVLDVCGLRLRAVYGDYDLAPFAASSPRQIAVAEPAPRRRAAGARRSQG